MGLSGEIHYHVTLWKHSQIHDVTVDKPVSRVLPKLSRCFSVRCVVHLVDVDDIVSLSQTVTDEVFANESQPSRDRVGSSVHLLRYTSFSLSFGIKSVTPVGSLAVRQRHALGDPDRVDLRESRRQHYATRDLCRLIEQYDGSVEGDVLRQSDVTTEVPVLVWPT